MRFLSLIVLLFLVGSLHPEATFASEPKKASQVLEEAEAHLFLEEQSVRSLLKFAYLNSEVHQQTGTVNWRVEEAQKGRAGICNGSQAAIGHDDFFRRLNGDPKVPFRFVEVHYSYYLGPFDPSKVEYVVFSRDQECEASERGLFMELTTNYDRGIEGTYVSYRLFFKGEGEDVRVQRVVNVRPGNISKKAGGGGAGTYKTRTDLP